MSEEPVKTGIEPIDARLGGLPPRRITLVSGAPGAGRTCLALAFLGAALRRGEPACLVTTDAPDAVIDLAARALGLELGPWIRRRALTILSYGTGFDAKIRSLGGIERPMAELKRLGAERRLEHLVLDTVDPILLAAEPSRLKQFLRAAVSAISGVGLTCLCTITDSGALQLAAEELASHVACAISLRRRGAGRFLAIEALADGLVDPTPVPIELVAGAGIVGIASAAGNPSVNTAVNAPVDTAVDTAVNIAAPADPAPALATATPTALTALPPAGARLHASATLLDVPAWEIGITRTDIDPMEFSDTALTSLPDASTQGLPHDAPDEHDSGDEDSTGFETIAGVAPAPETPVARARSSRG